MIHMLSRFDLKPGIDPGWFQDRYVIFVNEMRAIGLVESTGKIGRREPDTPMDTDKADAPAFYVVMSFKDRAQLDQAYEHISDPQARADAGHNPIHSSIDNFTFTCWRDLDAVERASEAS